MPACDALITMNDVENSDEHDLREQLRQAQEALRRSEQFALAGRFSGAIMHEINNPLEAITNLVYLAKVEAHDPERVKRYAQQAEEQLQLVRMIARQTLSFYREQRTAHDVDLVFEDLFLDHGHRLFDLYHVDNRLRKPGAAAPAVRSRRPLRQLAAVATNSATDLDFFHP